MTSLNMNLLVLQLFCVNHEPGFVLGSGDKAMEDIILISRILHVSQQGRQVDLQWQCCVCINLEVSRTQGPIIRYTRGRGKAFNKLLSWIWRLSVVGLERGRYSIFWANGVAQWKRREVPDQVWWKSMMQMERGRWRWMRNQGGHSCSPKMSLCDVLISSEFLWGMKCTSEGFKIGECHDQNCILERSLWMLCGDLELFSWICVMLWGICFISGEIQQW